MSKSNEITDFYRLWRLMQIAVYQMEFYYSRFFDWGQHLPDDHMLNPESVVD